MVAVQSRTVSTRQMHVTLITRIMPDLMRLISSLD